MNAYISLTEMKSRLSIPGTANDTTLRSIAEAASRAIDRFVKRFFYELVAVRLFDGVSPRNETIKFVTGDQIIVDPFGRKVAPTELEVPDFIAITTLKTDDDGNRTFEVTWAAADFLLGPPGNIAPDSGQDDAQPFTLIIVDREAGTKSSFPTGLRRIEVTARWGYWRRLLRAAETVGVAGINATATILPLSAVTDIKVGHTLLIETEQLYVLSITGTNATVRRSVNGTTAAAHAGLVVIDIYEYPSAVREATFLQASRLWRRKDSSIIEEVGLLETGQQNIQRGMDIEAQMLLRPYIKRRHMVVV